MDMFRVIDRALEGERESGRLSRAVVEWSTCGAFDGELSLDDLIRLCRGEASGSRRQKDQIHVALCTRACRKPNDELAGLLLCWLFLPGLSHLFQAFSPRWTADLDDLRAELLAGFWESASRVQPGSRYVARFLLLGARRRARKAQARAEPTLAFERLAYEAHHGSTRSMEAFVDDALMQALTEGSVTQRQLDLALASRTTIAGVARRWGLSLAAAQKARHRARQRLLEHLQDH